MTQFINLTPHAITVEGLGTLPPSGTVARVATIRTESVGIPNGFINLASGEAVPVPDYGTVPAYVRLIRQAFGEVGGLPAPQPDTIYIVSALVLSALGGSRPDVVAPDTGPDAIRESGQIVAVRGFVC